MKEQKCRICGCTDDDCSQCIKLTGKPCHWVEEDLCSACQDAIQKQQNKNDMNFFQQLALAGAGKVDINLRIMQKNDKFTMSILPGSHSSITKPMNITGTAAELDDKFFETIFPQAVEVLGIISNIDDVKKEADKKLSESKNKTPEKSAAKKEEKKPVKDTKKKTSKPEIKEASVFDQQPEDTAEKQTEIEDADTGEAPEAEETNEE